jgi:hypothetical protein
MRLPLTKIQRILAVWLLLPLIQGCSNDSPSPEEQIRQLIVAGEQAVESRSISAVQAQLSDQYADTAGHQKRTIARLLASYFISHQSIHLLTQVGAVNLIGEDQAEVTVFVAVAGQPLNAPSDFLSLRANLLRFDLTLIKEASQWLVRSASWRKADMGDFLE